MQALHLLAHALFIGLERSLQKLHLWACLIPLAQARVVGLDQLPKCKPGSRQYGQLPAEFAFLFFVAATLMHDVRTLALARWIRIRLLAQARVGHHFSLAGFCQAQGIRKLRKV